MLSLLGVDFKVVPSGFEEEWGRNDEVGEIVKTLSLRKAEEVEKRLRNDEERYLVIGGDTLIEKDGEIFGKATTERELKEMLARLSGKKHRVVTGVAMIDSWSGEKKVASEESWVKLIELTPDLVERYLKLPVWRGKAGGYAIQEDPLGLVESFEGNLSNIIGLPLGLAKALLEEMGWRVTETDSKILEDRLLVKMRENG